MCALRLSPAATTGSLWSLFIIAIIRQQLHVQPDEGTNAFIRESSVTNARPYASFLFPFSHLACGTGDSHCSIPSREIGRDCSTTKNPRATSRFVGRPTTAVHPLPADSCKHVAIVHAPPDEIFGKLKRWTSGSHNLTNALAST